MPEISWDGEEKLLESRVVAETASTEDEDDDEDEDLDAEDVITAARDIIRDSETLFEYLANPLFCQSVTKKERAAIYRHLEKLYAVSAGLDTFLEDVAEDEEESEV